MVKLTENEIKYVNQEGIGKGIGKEQFGLTPKQAKFLKFLANFMDQNGYSPSYEEMKQVLNYKSKSRIHAFVHSLKKRGYVRLIPYMKRSIIITSKGIGIAR